MIQFLVMIILEDFGMGVGDIGLNQGIPNGGDGKGTYATPLSITKRKRKRKHKRIPSFKEFLRK